MKGRKMELQKTNRNQSKEQGMKGSKGEQKKEDGMNGRKGSRMEGKN